MNDNREDLREQIEWLRRRLAHLERLLERREYEAWREFQRERMEALSQQKDTP